MEVIKGYFSVKITKYNKASQKNMHDDEKPSMRLIGFAREDEEEGEEEEYYDDEEE